MADPPNATVAASASANFFMFNPSINERQIGRSIWCIAHRLRETQYGNLYPVPPEMLLPEGHTCPRKGHNGRPVRPQKSPGGGRGFQLFQVREKSVLRGDRTGPVEAIDQRARNRLGPGVEPNAVTNGEAGIVE